MDGISWKQSIFEDNVATGVSPTAMGSNYPQYGHSHGNPSVQNIYHHNNSQSQVWGSVSVCPPASLPVIKFCCGCFHTLMPRDQTCVALPFRTER